LKNPGRVQKASDKIAQNGRFTAIFAVRGAVTLRASSCARQGMARGWRISTFAERGIIC
jgi:hypothetical protein